MNPEFIRYTREKLRSKYLIGGISIVIAIAVLVTIYIQVTRPYGYSSGMIINPNYFKPVDYTQIGLISFWVFFVFNSLILLLGNAFMCGSAVSTEKSQKTYTFQLMTRMSSFDLTLGKLFGAPIAGTFIFAIFFIFSLIGILAFGGISLSTFFIAYLLLICASIVVSSLALLMSTYLNQMWQVIIGIVGVIFGYFYIAVRGYSSYSYESGVSVLDFYKTITLLIDSKPAYTNVFGIEFTSFVAQVLFYLILAGIFAYMTIIRIKQIRSPWQKYHMLWIICSLLIIILAFLWPPVFNTFAGQNGIYSNFEYNFGRIDYISIFSTFLIISSVIIFLVSIGFMGDSHDFNLWLRKKLPPFVWLMEEKAIPVIFSIILSLGTLSIFLIAYLLLGFSSNIENNFNNYFYLSVLFVLFIVRETSYISIMRMTSHGKNVFLSLLYLGLFYIIGSVISGVFYQFSSQGSAIILSFFPLAYLSSFKQITNSDLTLIIVGIETAITFGILLFMLNQRKNIQNA